MKLVLDTNVLVSGLLNQSGPPCLILQHIAFPDIIICWDKRIMAEYQEVLSRPKFHFPPKLVTQLLDAIILSGKQISANQISAQLPDPDDLPFLEVARSAQADFLITGNHVHFPKELCLGQTVISPAEYLRQAPQLFS